VTGTGGMAEGSECCATAAGVNLMVQMEHIHHDWDEKYEPELGLKMCTGGPGGLPPASCDQCWRNSRALASAVP